MSRAGAVSFALAALFALLLAEEPSAQQQDEAILAHLQPLQRLFVMVAERNGVPHTLTVGGLISRANRPATPGVATPTTATQVASGPFNLAASGKAGVSDDLIARASIAYVPTTTSGKPAAIPEPQETPHDVAWVYQHRLDTPAPELKVPGIQVRSQATSPFDIGSGAFHGVRSVNGWSAIRVTVSIPCGARQFTTGPGYNELTREQGDVDQETGYIYIGGWGAGPQGVAVDGGLQKSSAQARRDEYAFYWKYGSNKPITSAMRFPCGGPDVVLELYPVLDSMLVYTATGVSEAGSRVTLTMVQRTKPGDGWIPSGGSATDGIILKRLVAIAQPDQWRTGPMLSGRFQNGSYFGIEGPTKPKPRIVWRNCEIGRVTPPAIAPRYQPWTKDEIWTSPESGVYLDWPPLGVLRDASGDCDAVGILLRRK